MNPLTSALEQTVPKDTRATADAAGSQQVPVQPERQVEATEQSATANSDQQQQEKKEFSQEDLTKAAERLEDWLKKSQQSVQFEAHDDSGQTIIRIYDKANSELLRQIPSEELVRISEQLNDLINEIGQKTGILFDETA